MFACPATNDFFRARIDQMIDLNHPLAVLAYRMPWQKIEASISSLLMEKAKTGKRMPDLDGFGEAKPVIGRKSNAGRPRIPLRIMISLLYLKHAFNESDESVVQRWRDTPRWQYFSGSAYYEDRLPCDASTLIKFRKLLGDEGIEELLAQTINTAVDLELIKPQELTPVIVDSTVQQKAIAYPTDSRLLEKVRSQLVEAAKSDNIELKQTYAKESMKLGHQIPRYAHAKQFKRMHRALKRMRVLAGRLLRDVQRKLGSAQGSMALQKAIANTNRLLEQVSHKKRVNGQAKLYSLHAPEVSCISKGKTRQPYEFGVKVGIVTTFNHNLIVGAKAFHDNPFDGHTLHDQIEQSTILMQDLNVKPTKVFVDLGYRGVEGDNPEIQIIHRRKTKRISAEDKHNLRRRQAIEPIIGHLKADHRMDRCSLQGKLGDRLHAVLCAAGYNIKWLLRMIAKKGVPFFLYPIFLTASRALGITWKELVSSVKNWVDEGESADLLAARSVVA